MNKKVLVIGSLNMDFSINIDKFPEIGETIIANDLNLIPGGKGANQAYALGKLGVNVSMIGAVGNDEYGRKLIDNLKSVSVNTEGIKIIDDKKTGCAFVNVDKNADNNIIVVSGANSCVTKELIEKNINMLDDADYIVLQLEIPFETIEYVLQEAKKRNKIIILDPAPAKKELNISFDSVNIIKPNITELEILTNMKINNHNDVVKAAKNLLNKGIKNVIVTLGEEGSILVNKDINKYFEPFKVNAIDSTAAGDCFIAGLVKSLVDGKDLESSIKYAHIVSSYSVTKKGAQSSMPTEDELSFYIKELKDNYGINKERIIIDCDPGTDDAFALLVAGKYKELILEGVTTVSGNCSLENATNNALSILNLINRNDVLVYKGMEGSLEKENVDATDVHGNNGLGGVVLEKSNRTPENKHAVDYMINMVNSNPHEITIVALGPLTNIAEALERDENFSKNLKQLIIMGGGEDLGNITTYAEFNFYKDSKSAKKVFEKFKGDIFIVPLNVTHRLPLNKVSEDRLQYLNYHIKNDNSNIAEFLYNITRIAKKRDADLGGPILHDVTTIIYLVDNSTLKFKKVDIEITTDGEKDGMCTLKENEFSNVNFAYSIDFDKAYKILFKILFDIEIK